MARCPLSGQQEQGGSDALGAAVGPVKSASGGVAPPLLLTRRSTKSEAQDSVKALHGADARATRNQRVVNPSVGPSFTPYALRTARLSCVTNTHCVLSLAKDRRAVLWRTRDCLTCHRSSDNGTVHVRVNGGHVS
jgi:hypothetical protein